MSVDFNYVDADGDHVRVGYRSNGRSHVDLTESWLGSDDLLRVVAEIAADPEHRFYAYGGEEDIAEALDFIECAVGDVDLDKLVAAVKALRARVAAAKVRATSSPAK